MTELRRRTPLSQSRVSRVVIGLEADGLVRRASGPTDSRAVSVAITPRGLEIFDAARPRHHRDLHEHRFSILTEDEIGQLATITVEGVEPQPTKRRATSVEALVTAMWRRASRRKFEARI
jgi:DNA-binding MarR family transcriptional regulator